MTQPTSPQDAITRAAGRIKAAREAAQAASARVSEDRTRRPDADATQPTPDAQ